MAVTLTLPAAAPPAALLALLADGPDLFYGEGAAGVEWEDGEVVQPDWADDVPVAAAPFVRAYFPADEASGARMARLRGHAGRLGWRISVDHVNEADWANAWKQYYHAIRPGRRIWVVPAWEEPPEPDAPVIRMDPGMAFGTGAHPTTAMMLAAVEETVRAGQRWVDVGTGSGILALAAWLMGARVTAVEPDPIAVRVAEDNVRRHDASIPIVSGTLGDLIPTAPFDGVLANLTVDLLVSELTHLLQVSGPHTVWLLSGIRAERSQLLLQGLERCGRVVTSARDSDGWLLWRVVSR